MARIIIKDGQKYMLIGDKAIPFDSFDENGKPIIKVESKETPNDRGGKDVEVRIPCLKITGENKLK